MLFTASVVDPNTGTLNLDPDPELWPIRIQGFSYDFLEKKNSMKIIFF